MWHLKSQRVSQSQVRLQPMIYSLMAVCTDISKIGKKQMSSLRSTVEKTDRRPWQIFNDCRWGTWYVTVSVSAMEPREAAYYDFKYLGYLLRYKKEQIEPLVNRSSYKQSADCQWFQMTWSDLLCHCDSSSLIECHRPKWGFRLWRILWWQSLDILARADRSIGRL